MRACILKVHVKAHLAIVYGWVLRRRGCSVRIGCYCTVSRRPHIALVGFPVPGRCTLWMGRHRVGCRPLLGCQRSRSKLPLHQRGRGALIVGFPATFGTQGWNQCPKRKILLQGYPISHRRHRSIIVNRYLGVIRVGPTKAILKECIYVISMEPALHS
jgi:hypothetical protein